MDKLLSDGRFLLVAGVALAAGLWAVKYQSQVNSLVWGGVKDYAGVVSALAPQGTLGGGVSLSGASAN